MTLVRNLEIGTQFLDSENLQHNLGIAQISRLHGTNALWKVESNLRTSLLLTKHVAL